MVTGHGRATMTTTEPVPTRQPSAFARAENASRRVLVVVSAGVLAWGVGSILAVNLREAFAELVEVETGLGAIAEHWVFQRVWLVALLAPVAWLGGRFLGGGAAGFVLPAVLVGEALGLSIDFLRDGSPFHSWEDVGAWAVSLGLAVIPSFFTFAAGARAFERARQQSLADASARQAEYDAFIARATGDGGPADVPRDVVGPAAAPVGSPEAQREAAGAAAAVSPDGGGRQATGGTSEGPARPPTSSPSQTSDGPTAGSPGEPPSGQ